MEFSLIHSVLPHIFLNTVQHITLVQHPSRRDQAFFVPIARQTMNDDMRRRSGQEMADQFDIFIGGAQIERAVIIIQFHIRPMKNVEHLEFDPPDPRIADIT